MRFTLTQDNAADLPGLLDLVEAERIDKFYLSHLNYAGRGNVNRKRDAQFAHHARGDGPALRALLGRMRGAALDKEFVTGNNDADGVYLLHWARRNIAALDEDAPARQARANGAATPRA